MTPKPPTHLIDRAWEQFRFHKSMAGEPPTERDKDYFIGGFFACFGVLAGTLDVGIPEGCPTQLVMAQLYAELDQLALDAQRRAIVAAEGGRA